MFEAYASGYEAFRRECGFSPAEQEVIFLAISRENGCDYCMAAHSFVADTMSNVPVAITDAILDGGPIADPKFGALAAFTAKMVASRGRPTDEDVRAFLAAGYNEKNILGIILAIGVKTLSNCTNHVFHTPIDTAFEARERSDVPQPQGGPNEECDRLEDQVVDGSWPRCCSGT